MVLSDLEPSSHPRQVVLVVVVTVTVVLRTVDDRLGWLPVHCPPHLQVRNDVLENQDKTMSQDIFAL